MTLDAGQILNARYRIVELLGHGGFGAVYRAWDLNVDHPCAIKENFDTSPEAQAQFMREATVLANLAHANLPRVTDHFVLPGQGQYLVMDFIEGEDLESLVGRVGPLPADRALAWIGQIADALTYLHAQNPPVLHRDIKPANIRITPDGRAVLVDFGLVKIYDPALRTAAAARGVTPGFAPLEQYGQGNTDPRTDVYALSATLYKLLTGLQPQESVQRVVNDALRPASLVNASVPPVVSQALQRGMALHPSQRFQSVSELRTALLAQPGFAPAASAPATTQPAFSAAPAAPPSTAPGAPPAWAGAAQSPVPPAARRRSVPVLALVAGGALVCAVVACVALVAWSGLGAPAPAPSATPRGPGVEPTLHIKPAPATAGPTVLPTEAPPPTDAPTAPPLTVDAETERLLRQAILDSDQAEIEAGRAVTTSGLDAYYTGAALQLVESYIGQLQGAQMVEDAALVDSRDWSFALADANHAEVTVTEVWSSQMFDRQTGGLLAYRVNDTLPQVYSLEKDGDGWKVAGIQFLQQGSGFQTVWEEPFDNNDRGWYSANGYSVGDGVYTMASQKGGSSYPATCTQCPVLSTFTYQASFRVARAGQDGVYGLIFDTDTSSRYYTFYAFLVSPKTGQFYLGKFAADRQWEAIQDWTKLPAALGKSNTLKAGVQPGRFALYVNDREVATLDDPAPFTAGTFGLMRGGDIEVEADDLHVDLPGLRQP